ncbi:hypothetical protein AL08_01880 [Corynebacterium diphtheriae bv. gravis str. ISS 4746]|nr:hypothetical protein AL08_01880 [Corynebacterium diphtheriae bv. gravis str. ISS 4746]KLN45229.1 hypothetical protein AL09_02010 [Corynebacterium diphtheriae bv. gravis str. ISS 4749]
MPEIVDQGDELLLPIELFKMMISKNTMSPLFPQHLSNLIDLIGLPEVNMLN